MNNKALEKGSDYKMKSQRLFQIKNSVTLFIFIVSTLFTVYIASILLDENLDIGQLFLSFILFISLFFTLIFTIGFLRHFIGFTKKSWKFYTLQFLLSGIVSFFIVLLFSSSAITHSQEKMFSSVKNKLTPIITYIEKYQKQHGKIPESIHPASINATSINNIYYFATSDNFILGVNIPSLDIDGAQIFYDSRDRSWHQFHNDKYQQYQDKKEKSNSIEKYISFQKQKGFIISTFKKTDTKWINTKEIKK